MKRSKTLLTAMLVVAVVGGALAFKPAPSNGNFYCTSDPGGSGSTTLCKIAPGGTNNGTRYSVVTDGGTPLYCASRGSGPAFLGGNCETEQRRVVIDQ